MTGGRHHGIVDGDDTKSGNPVAIGLQGIHFGDLLLQRAAGQRFPEGGFLKSTLLAVGEPVGAGILALVVAEDAVISLIQRMGKVHAIVGESESLAPPQGMGVGQFQRVDAAALLGVQRNQVHRVHLGRNLE